MSTVSCDGSIVVRSMRVADVSDRTNERGGTAADRRAVYAVAELLNRDGNPAGWGLRWLSDWVLLYDMVEMGIVCRPCRSSVWI